MMASVQILYWKDIPVQVRARDEKGRASLPMPDRFQVAVDQAAMLAGLTGSDAYTELYEWQNAGERPGSAQEAAATVVAELDARFDSIDWRKTAAAVKHE
jgi:Virulence factor